MAGDSCTAGKDKKAKIVSFLNRIGVREWGKMGAKNVNSETCTVLNFKALWGVVIGGEERSDSQLMEARLWTDSVGSTVLGMLSSICTLHLGDAVDSVEDRLATFFPAISLCWVAPLKMANCFLLAFNFSGSLTSRTLFPVSNLFISQDPRLSYLHVHCKCNVNESSDKIFLYFVISKEFLYRRTQWRLACTPGIIFE